MYASIFGNLTVIIQRLYLQNFKQHEGLRLVRNFVRFYEIPQALREDLEKHVINDACAMTISDINEVSFSILFIWLTFLPPSLQRGSFILSRRFHIIIAFLLLK